MKTPPTVAIIALAAATIVSGTIAWQQYQRAERLEAAAAAVRVAETDPHIPASMASDPAPPPSLATHAKLETDDAPPEPAPDHPMEAQRVRGGRGDPGARFNQLMENPEFAAAWLAQQKARLDDRYATLFRKLNLNPAQVDQLKTLLAERQASQMDVMSAARSEGLTGRDNRDELRALVQQTQNEIDGSIRALLGETAFNQLQQYERTAPQRSLVNQLETRLSYSSSPLTAAQSDALVNILAETTGPGRTATGQMTTTMSFGPGGAAMSFAAGGGTITDAAIARAQGVLTPSQVETLKQLQAEQQSQRQINEMMRRQFQSNRTTTPPSRGTGGG